VLKDPTSILPGATSRLAQMILSGVLAGLERFTGIGFVREVSEFVTAIDVSPPTPAISSRASGRAGCASAASS
jgi:hypothetical protein